MIFDKYAGALANLNTHRSDFNQLYVALTGDGDISLSGNGTIFCSSASPTTGWYYVPTWTPPSPNYGTRIKVKKLTDIIQALGTMHRITGGPSVALATGYLSQWYKTSGQWQLYKHPGFVAIGTAVTSAVDDGDVFDLLVWGTGTVNFKLLKNGTSIYTASDTVATYDAAGKAGVRLYTEVTPSNTTGYHLDKFQAYSLTPEFTHASIDASGDAEISWESVPPASLYTIYRATTIGGTYTSLDTTTELYYLDTGYSGHFYKVTATIDGVEYDQTAAITPAPYADYDLTATVVVPSPNPRHNVLTDGTDDFTACAENLHFDQNVTIRTLPDGANSLAELFNDGFTGGAPLATLTTGTLDSCGGGSCSVSATAGNWATLRYNDHLPAPNFASVVDITSADEDVKVGYGIDNTHGIFVRYDKGAGTIDIYGINGGGETSFLTPVSRVPTTPYRLALEVGNLCFHAWLNEGSGWELIGAGFSADGGTYDLRTPATMAAWYPIALFGNGAGSTTTVLSGQRLIGYSGSGSVREATPVTYLDGTPAQFSNGNWPLCSDRCGPIPAGIGNPVSNVCFSVHEYDAEARDIVGTGSGPIASVSLETGGQTISAQDAKIVYDPEAGVCHFWSNDWSKGPDEAFPSTTKVFYQAVPIASLNDLRGFIHLDSVVEISVPAGVSTDNIYGVDVVKFNNRWYMAATYSDLATYFDTIILSGDNPDDFDTIEEQFTARNNEGCSWFPLGDRLYLIAGDLALESPGFGFDNVMGIIAIWDFSDFTNLTYLGQIDYPNPMTDEDGVKLPQQPTIIHFHNGNFGRIQIIGFQDIYYSTYADAGKLYIVEANLELAAWQFPTRLVIDPITYTATSALAAGGADSTSTATHNTSGNSATAAVVSGGASSASTGTHNDPDYTAIADTLAGGADFSGNCSFGTVVFTASGAFLNGGVDSSSTATFVSPTYTATTALLVGGSDFSGNASFGTQIFAATGAFLVGGADSASASTFNIPQRSATASPLVGGADSSSTATHNDPDYTATISIIVGAATLSATAATDVSIFTGTAGLIVGGSEVTTVGVSIDIPRSVRLQINVNTADRLIVEMEPSE